MKLAGKKAAVILTEDGRQVVQLAKIGLPETSLLAVVIHETEDLGIWLRIERGEDEHCFLLRWEYVLGIDVANERSENLLGLRR
ncbi:MAG: hypothetical protein ACP5FH_07845 [Terracidiphilus sp.]